MDTVIDTGKAAPNFQLYDLGGNLHSLQDAYGWIVVLNFWSAECEWCERVDRELITYLNAWKERVKIWWIASNAHESAEFVARLAAERKLPTVLLDRNQLVADLYGAQTTPHFFVVDGQGKLRYQGAWDNVSFRQKVASVVYIPQVVQALLRGNEPMVTQSTPYGCTIVRLPG